MGKGRQEAQTHFQADETDELVGTPVLEEAGAGARPPSGEGRGLERGGGPEPGQAGKKESGREWRQRGGLPEGRALWRFCSDQPAISD